MYAVIRTGGKQYKVAEKDTIALARLKGDAGDAVAFDDVLMVGGEDGVTLGTPTVAGATVAGEIVEHGRSATILVFKKRRRQNSKRSHGHRQHHTLVRITEIVTDGKAPAKKAAPETKVAKAEAATDETKTDKPKRAAPKKAPAKADAPKAAAKKPRASAAKADKE